MADNTTLNLGTGGDVIASDDIAGVKHQRVKISVGADGSATDLSAANPMPIGALPAGTANIGDVDVLTIAAGDNNIGNVDIVTMPAVAGGAAQDAGITGNPVPVGWRASAAAPTDMSADGDVVYVWATRKGALNVQVRDGQGDSVMDDTNNAMRVNIVAGAAAGGTSTTDGGTFARDAGALTPIGCRAETAAPTLTDGDIGVPSMTTGGAMRVSVAGGSVAGIVEDTAHAGTEEGLLSMVVRDDALATLTPVDNDHTVMRVNSRGALWAALDTGVANPVTLQASTATQEVVGDAAIDAGISGNPVLMGGRASTATPGAVSADGDVQTPWLTREGAVKVSDFLQPAAGGADSYSAISAAAALSASIKASPGKVFSIQCFNLNAAARYVRLYNQTGAPGTGDGANILWRGIIPGNTAGAGFTAHFPKGKQFTTGIAIRATTGIADNDAGALAANELTFNVDYN